MPRLSFPLVFYIGFISDCGSCFVFFSQTWQVYPASSYPLLCRHKHTDPLLPHTLSGIHTEYLDVISTHQLSLQHLKISYLTFRKKSRKNYSIYSFYSLKMRLFLSFANHLKYFFSLKGSFHSNHGFHHLGVGA